MWVTYAVICNTLQLLNLSFSRFQSNMFYLISQKKFYKIYLPYISKGRRLIFFLQVFIRTFRRFGEKWLFFHSFVSVAIVTHIIQPSGIILLIEFIAVTNMWVRMRNLNIWNQNIHKTFWISTWLAVDNNSKQISLYASLVLKLSD